MHSLFLPLVTFVICRKVYRNLASTYADIETFCTVLLTSQVVMEESLQPKGREFKSMCILFYLLPFLDLYNVHLL